MSVLFVTAKWSVGYRCPTPWEVGVGVWPANVVDASDFFFY